MTEAGSRHFRERETRSGAGMTTLADPITKRRTDSTHRSGRAFSKCLWTTSSKSMTISMENILTEHDPAAGLRRIGKQVRRALVFLTAVALTGRSLAA